MLILCPHTDIPTHTTPIAQGLCFVFVSIIDISCGRHKGYPQTCTSKKSANRPLVGVGSRAAYSELQLGPPYGACSVSRLPDQPASSVGSFQRLYKRESSGTSTLILRQPVTSLLPPCSCSVSWLTCFPRATFSARRRATSSLYQGKANFIKATGIPKPLHALL